MTPALNISNLLTASGFHLDLDFALVGKGSLDALPLADEVLSLQCDGERLQLLQRGEATWSSVGPRHNLRVSREVGFEDWTAAREFFLGEVTALSRMADGVDGALISSGMHPWLRAQDIQRWPHHQASSTRLEALKTDALGNLFGLQRHGFGNQQALGLALPFSCEQEFSALYASLRFLLPLMPALSASSPFSEGKLGPASQCRVGARHDFLTTRPAFAMTSVQRLVPPALTELGAFDKLVADPLDSALQDQGLHKSLSPREVSASGLWVERSRGLVRICLLDGQECLQSSLSICAAVLQLSREIAFGTEIPSAELDAWPAARLDELVAATVLQGEQAILRDAEYLRIWGFPEGSQCRASELLQFLWEDRLAAALEPGLQEAMEVVALRGSLSTRLLAALPPRWNEEDLFSLYRRVHECLVENTLLL